MVKTKKRKAKASRKIKGHTVTIRKNNGGLSPWSLLIEAPDHRVIFHGDHGYDTKSDALRYAKYLLGV